MAQGKEWNKDEVIEILRPYFQLGCNVTKACAYAGISRTTVQTWIEDDETLRLKVQGWQSEMSTQARKNWKKRLDEGDFQAANEWLTKKEKDEFSTRTENTGAEGGPIQVEDSAAIKALTEQLNEIHRGTSLSSDGGASSALDSQAQDK